MAAATPCDRPVRVAFDTPPGPADHTRRPPRAGTPRPPAARAARHPGSQQGRPRPGFTDKKPAGPRRAPSGSQRRTAAAVPAAQHGGPCPALRLRPDARTNSATRPPRHFTPEVTHVTAGGLGAATSPVSLFRQPLPAQKLLRAGELSTVTTGLSRWDRVRAAYGTGSLSSPTSRAPRVLPGPRRHAPTGRETRPQDGARPRERGGMSRQVPAHEKRAGQGLRGARPRARRRPLRPPSSASGAVRPSRRGSRPAGLRGGGEPMRTAPEAGRRSFTYRRQTPRKGPQICQGCASLR